ncbi:RagB/SusD family nutrient uptake outer membrane protein [Fibrella sp. HMF5335]|uniref:RagB/SusD family nutrient uptake outer membrane protein n=1 Tax=Fibrella rubiginis TaxID=2817060 RepID=A0A939GGC9_9BACT|nr:RagB/SusD family nutrient uptake outer membrane protein [Fibrella rubiginis]MBO0936980.1 RagB/SusD family nutrient uptake outer membrane protein [Fibrella rubiginis]
MKPTYITLLAAALWLGGCKDLDLAPTDRFTEATYWTSADRALTVLNTAYSGMFTADLFFANDALSDNAYNQLGDFQGANSIARGSYDPALGRIKGEWDFHYGGIKTTHILLGNIDRIPSIDAALKARIIAETRFIRAFHYFQLMTWYGDVPLFTKDISIEESRTVARTPRADVLAFVLAELDAAAANLPTNVQYAAADKGRITKGAAIALKARALLYESRWAEVATACEQLIDNTANGTYGLFPSYEGLFLPQNENSQESILSLGFAPETRTHGNFRDFVPISIGDRVNNIAPTQELVDSYLTTNGKAITEAGSGFSEKTPYANRDPRLTATIVYDGYQWKKADGTTTTIYIKPGSTPANTDARNEFGKQNASTTGYYVRKYYDPTANASFQSGLDLMLIRYADVLLMYAEAKNEQGQLTAAIWDKTIGALRRRAGFTDAAALTFPTGATQATLREAVRRERRVELAMEGLRVFDIRRWRIAETVLNGFAHGAKFGDPTVDNGYARVDRRNFDKDKQYLWPIPQIERDLNQNLSQNPKW